MGGDGKWAATPSKVQNSQRRRKLRDAAGAGPVKRAPLGVKVC